MNAESISGNHDTDIDALVGRLLSGPADASRPFVPGAETYAQVHAMADRITTVLNQQTAVRQPVCLCSDDRVLVAAALLAALSGGPPLLLPYAFSEQALAETRQSIAFSIALVDGPRPLPEGVRAIDPATINATAPEPSAGRPCAPDGHWIYLFTGGSTGKPKTWTKTPRNLLAEAAFLAHAFTVDQNDTILATVPPNHIYGLLYSVLVPLLTSAQVCNQTPAFPNEIDSLLDRTGATILISIPAHYRALKNHPVKRHRLRTAFSSAGALAPEDDQAFFDATGVTITEVYGSTETGGIALRRRTASQPGLVPFSCVDWRIDRESLHVRSDFLSPELETDAHGFYPTADRAEAETTAGFRLLGRSDGIVKVAGKRVDLMNIQQLLQQTPGVTDAYVFARKSGQGRENEILALAAGQTSAAELRTRLQQRLEPYALPRSIKVVAQMPVSAVGKYDRAPIEKLFGSDS